MNRTRWIRTIARGAALFLLAALVMAACNPLRSEDVPTPTLLPPTDTPPAAAPTDTSTATSVAAAPPAAEQARTQAATATPTETTAPPPTPTATATPTAAALSSARAKEKPPCGAEGVLTVLLLGEADPETPGERGADAIRYAQIDFDRLAVRVLALPPDLLMDATEIPSLGADQVTLTAAYWRAKENRNGSERVKMVAGTEVMAQLLADQFGLSADQYLSMKQPFFEEAVDELGGLHIDIPYTVEGRPDGMGVFEAGEQVLTGEQTLEYVEILSPGPEPGPVEYARLARQRVVLEALYAQLTQLKTIIRLPGLIQVYQRNVVTDLRLPQLYDLSCVLRQKDLDVEFFTIGTDLVTPQDSVLVPHTDEIRAFVEDTFGD
jgi:anionic cell wall polymer biosynthesis LytR-Cps2A-Psr (LCP) family protein